MNKTSSGHSAATLLTLYTAVILLAANGLFAKGIPLDAVTITQLRSVVGTLFMAILLLVISRPLALKSLKQYFHVSLLGIIMGLHWVTFFHAMQLATIAIGMVSLYTFPVMIVCLEAAVNRHWPRWQDCLLALVVFIGIILIAGNDNAAENGDVVAGVIYGVISATLFSVRNILQKYYFADVSSDRLMLYQMLAIGFMLLLFADFQSALELNILSWLKILALGIVSTALAHTLLVKSYKNLSAKTVSMISCLQPPLAALMAWLVIGETLTLWVAVGGAIILLVAFYESVNPAVK